VEFTLQYRQPIFPDTAYTMWWEVAATEPRGRHWQVDWLGAVGIGDAQSIAGRGTILILDSD
ncbi:MAG TPA: hypothetical protein VH761_04910, partial [Ilumatobacteraceae bacterium]